MNQKIKGYSSFNTDFVFLGISEDVLLSVSQAIIGPSFTTSLMSLKAYDIFNSLLTKVEKTVADGENVGMIRAMADFADAAYNLQHPGATEYVDINDIGTYANAAYSAVINDKVGAAPI
jgi:hypothetical protein